MPASKTLSRLLFPYRQTLHTITTDNGSEFTAHQEITRRLSLKGKNPVVVYFADSYPSWQKETIENTNKLIRKYIPKKANFDDFSDWKIKEIQKKLNRIPREKLILKPLKNDSSIASFNFAFAVGLYTKSGVV